MNSTVPRACPAQMLRLELGNPDREADTPGNVPARLRGTLWYDDIKVSRID